MILQNFVYNNDTWNQRPCQRFAHDIFISISFNENFSILIKFSIMFAPKGPIVSNPAAV